MHLQSPMLYCVANISSDAQVAAQLFHALSEPTRVALLDVLSTGDHRVSHLVELLDGTQGNISGHLACLKGCGLVTDRRVGREVYYSIAHPQVVAVLRAATALLATNGTTVELCHHYTEPTTRAHPVKRQTTSTHTKSSASAAKSAKPSSAK
jgi:ArsR family transcriptional regulator, cadmium/lead-responsive transcriptional repressor